MNKRLDIKLLEFLEPKGGIPQTISINKFILSNFEKPNLIPANEKDEAMVLLRQLQAEELVEFIRGAACVTVGTMNNEQTIIYWWDNFSGEDYYKITRKGISYLDQYRISQIAIQTNESVKLTNKWTLRIISATLFVTMVNVGVLIINNNDDNEKHQLLSAISSKQVQLDSLQSMLNQQQSLINHHSIPRNKKNRGKKQVF